VDRDGKPTPFSYDSWRSVSNWSVDQTVLSDRIQSSLYNQGIHTFVDRYTFDCRPLSTRHSTVTVATTAVGSFATTDGPTSKAFVDELWNTPLLRRACYV
jgi:oligosaccharide reducing-end xylanase